MMRREFGEQQLDVTDQISRVEVVVDCGLPCAARGPFLNVAERQCPAIELIEPLQDICHRDAHAS